LQKEINLSSHLTGIFLIILSLFFISCEKHESLNFSSHQINTNDEITGVYFSDHLNGIAVGGNTWTRAIVCRTNDGGLNWSIDSLFDKEIFCIGILNPEHILAMGIEMNLYEFLGIQNIVHKINHRGNFKFIRAMAVIDSNHILAVHGLGNGSIEKFGLHSDSTTTVLDIRNDLNCIQCLDNKHCVAGGYGILLNTSDGGEVWDTVNLTGDHFIDISVVQPSAIFVLGAGGSVIRSDDYGAHFIQIKSGGIINSSPPFRCIGFRNLNEGMIAGEDGLIMITRNAGADWNVVDGLPVFDVKDIFIDENSYWLCGSGGHVIVVKL
jgi:photosystem II stability/assembly factor-like uncharacterized protein